MMLHVQFQSPCTNIDKYFQLSGLMKNSVQCVDKTGGKSTGEGQIAIYIGFKGVLLVELCTFTNCFVQGWMYIFDKPIL